MTQAQARTVTVWRAPRNYRIGTIYASVLLVALSVYVLVMYQYLAVLGVALVLGAVGRIWWMVVRPRMVAGPEGVDVLWTRTPEHIDWKDIRGVEPTQEGLKIACSGGRTVLARYPQKPAGRLTEPTEAEVTAAFLAQRAAWQRKPSGPEPVYTPPPPPAKPGKGRK